MVVGRQACTKIWIRAPLPAALPTAGTPCALELIDCREGFITRRILASYKLMPPRMQASLQGISAQYGFAPYRGPSPSLPLKGCASLLHKSFRSFLHIFSGAGFTKEFRFKQFGFFQRKIKSFINSTNSCGYSERSH